MKPWSVVAAALCAIAVIGAASLRPAGAADSASSEVLAAETARTTALDHADIPTLEKLLGDDLTYVHASGKTDTKATFLDAIRSDQLHYISWQAKTMHVRVTGDTAVLDGEYLVRVIDRRVKPDPFDVNIFILTVYARRNARWQQIAWQSTRDVALSPN